MDLQKYIVRKVRRIAILPTFPDIVREIASLIEDPMSSASDLARHMDPSMSSEVLRIANTAYFGSRNFRNIVTVERAIAVIGYEHLAVIILNMPFLSLLTPGDGEFDKAHFIRHSVLSGILARAIALHAVRRGQNEAYIAGILHDIGKIIIRQYLAREWQEIESRITTGRMDRVEAEKSVLGMDHAAIGGLLLDVWNIPQVIGDAVRFHHAPESALSDPAIATATALGNQLARELDPRLNLDDFNDFVVRHKEFSARLKEEGFELGTSSEVQFFSHIFNSLKSASLLLGQIPAGEEGEGER